MGIYRTFRALTLTAAATTMAAAPVWAADKEPVRLAPNSKWVMNYGDDNCRLIRGFGDGKQSSAFYMERYGPGDSFAMLMAGKPFNKLSRRSKIEVQFGPAEGIQEPRFFKGDFGNFGTALIFSSLSIERPESTGLKGQELLDFLSEELAKQDPDDSKDMFGEEREAKVEWVTVSSGGKDAVVLELGAMNKPFAALRTCTDTLLESWGVDTTKLIAQSRPLKAVESPGEWLKSSDYPMGLLQTGQQGLVQVRLSVDENGIPTECHIQRSTRPQEFGDIVCKRMMQRARFYPALDAEGKPFASYFRTGVRFQMRN